MPLSMYEASVPVFCRGLRNLSAILDRAERQAAERRIEPAVLLHQRLAPDMYPLDHQVQTATNFAKGAAARLAGIEAPQVRMSSRVSTNCGNGLAGQSPSCKVSTQPG